MTRHAITAGLLLLLAQSCTLDSAEDDSSDGGDEAGEIGDACGRDSDCVSGTCAPAGVCTFECEMHVQCGCQGGTTNADILAGRCPWGCIDGVCAKVCRNDLDCAGDTECTTGTFDACL